ncbi:Phosphoglycolate phosphatase 2 [Porphyridium purpureum]|uniref:Phosphoglycolate phosphatase 2 n=1 Tax=Porphyridium purpureum TaxID=35688 RepID=A0A5J4YYA0_PORPP|nr:Phosphoglycolate phosphatase 2 [Porphyridium purpureum]|eukprot:POR5781..scf209_3
MFGFQYAIGALDVRATGGGTCVQKRAAHYPSVFVAVRRRRHRVTCCVGAPERAAEGVVAAAASPELKAPRCVLLDQDGVLWHGESSVEGSADAVKELRARGIRTIFVTNNVRFSRRGYAQKLKRNGIDARPDDIVTSGSALASYVKSKHSDIKTAYVIGEPGLVEELESVGIRCFRHDASTEMDEALFANLSDMSKRTDEDKQMQLPERCDLVAIGWDLQFSMAKMSYASFFVQKGALFLATNLDAQDKSASGYLMPGTGPMVGALECATGRAADAVIGKPSALLIETILTEFGVERADAMMVGDRLDTDILFAKNGGIGSVLVLTGCTTEQELAELDPSDIRRPDHVFPSLAHYVAALPSPAR